MGIAIHQFMWLDFFFNSTSKGWNNPNSPFVTSAIYRGYLPHPIFKWRVQMSSDPLTLVILLFKGDDKLTSYIGIMISQYEDSHESTSKMECHKGFLTLLNFLGGNFHRYISWLKRFQLWWLKCIETKWKFQIFSPKLAGTRKKEKDSLEKVKGLYKLGGGNSNIFYVHPYMGKMIQFDQFFVEPPTIRPCVSFDFAKVHVPWQNGWWSAVWVSGECTWSGPQGLL